MGSAAGRKPLGSRERIGLGVEMDGISWMGFLGWDFDPLVPPATPGVPWICLCCGILELLGGKEIGVELEWVHGVKQGKIG